MNNQEQKRGENQRSEEDKKRSNQAAIDSSTHLEDDETNGTTTAPTPKAVEGSQSQPNKPKKDDPGHGKTVTPTED